MTWCPAARPPACPRTGPRRCCADSGRPPPPRPAAASWPATWITDLRRLDARLRANDTDIRTALAATGSTLTEVHGVGPILAATVLAQAGRISRFPSADHFASYTGTAPLDASSGQRVRHRLNTGGNRRLNTALHTIALCRARDPGHGRDYYQRKISEDKTPAEARRALKRRLANVLYRHLQQDQQRATTAA